MNMGLRYVVVPTVLLLLCIVHGGNGNKLLLILLDGFRWDYLKLTGAEMPGFNQLFKNGVTADKLIPVFPSVSAPNHFSLITGLYTESHGAIGNKMYDVTTGRILNAFDGSLDSSDIRFIFEEAEPLWITATKQGKNAYVFFWVCCDVKYDNIKPKFCLPYPGQTITIPEFRASITESLDLFKDNSADLAIVYFEGVDAMGHQFGPGSSEIKQLVKELDVEMQSLVKGLSSRRLEDDVDVMIFSDHGMTDISTNMVAYMKKINNDDIDLVIKNGPFVYIWPKKGKVQKVYSSLLNSSEHLTVWLREDFPTSWHFRDNSRIPEILVTAELGWYIGTPHFRFPYYNETGPMRGAHGFDVTENDMAGLFVAMGPSFRKNVKTDKLYNVDLYQMMCRSLGVQPRPHNGSMARVSMLVTDTASPATTTSTPSAALVLIICTVIIINEWRLSL